jgi:hypothetical protein
LQTVSLCLANLCAFRAFNEILKIDRQKYGADEEYEITDTIADEWQQRVDDVVLGPPAA